MTARRFPPPWSVEELEAWNVVPALCREFTFIGPKGQRPSSRSLLGCVLAVVAVALKIKLDTPQGPQPLARAIVTTHLQQLRGELALP